MALTPAQRKKLLGFGGLLKAANRAGCSLGHMSQVNSLKKRDPDGVARRAITEVIRENLAAQGLTLLEHNDIWPAPQPDRAMAAIVAGAKGQ
jgi:hypothetical protein